MSGDAPALATGYQALAEELTRGATRCATCGEPSVRVGTDVQEIAAVADAVSQHGERYLRRLFTDREVEDSRGAGSGDSAWTEAGAASLAGRYAVKESVVKVLRAGSGVDWTAIETVRHGAGWPVLVLHGPARALADEAGLSAWTTAFAHDGGVAVATVLARHACVVGAMSRSSEDLGE